MLAGSAFSVPAQAATTAAQYKLVIAQGAPGTKFPQTEFSGINNDGDIFGIADEQGGLTLEGFLLKAGSATMQFLGTPGDPGNTNSEATPPRDQQCRRRRRLRAPPLD
jgi:hypothetical protein